MFIHMKTVTDLTFWESGWKFTHLRLEETLGMTKDGLAPALPAAFTQFPATELQRTTLLATALTVVASHFSSLSCEGECSGSSMN